VLKRAFDLVAASGLLLVGWPLLALVALFIKLDDGGSVFFRQERLGRGGRAFRVWKFRTMRVNAPDLRNSDGSTYNAEDDPRVTRLGRFLRQSSLDELPQLFNVVLGDMSLVGPRPDLIDAPRFYRPQDAARLTVRPGITGWAQVHGRNALEWQARRDLDLEYVARRSFWLDLVILLRTIPVVFGRHGIFSRRAMTERRP
jgi:undecaprenyl phosphate N,N'-diacetylbacillosamine 1-phosphate transferase